MTDTKVAQIQTSAVAESNAVNMAQMLERMALNPQCDVGKLEKLYELADKMNRRAAEAAFSSALAEMQSKLPAIGERGKVQGRYTYALWEDINTIIRPHLHAHGFALSFRTDFAQGISVTGVLSHSGGHSERTTITLPADKSGNKPDVQAVASSISYGKRYAASALLNLTTHGEDDDAFRAHVDVISEDQCATLESLIDDVKADKGKFLKYLKVKSLSELPAVAYADAVAALNAKRKA